MNVTISAPSTQALLKEQLTVMDVTGCMWQITIEGSKVKVVHNSPVQVTWQRSQ